MSSSPAETTVHFSFAASLDLVGLVREYVSQLLHSQGFSEGFCYRTEIVVDELWRNAITYGLQSPTARIETVVAMSEEGLRLSVFNEGGTDEEFERLQKKIVPLNFNDEDTLGLTIVRILTNSISVDRLSDGRMGISVVRKKVA